MGMDAPESTGSDAPKCATCMDFGNVQSVKCVNGCEYCDTSQATCGTQQKSDVWATVRTSTFGVPGYLISFNIAYTWNFTKGMSGDIMYRHSSDIRSEECGVTVNGKECASCKMTACNGNHFEPTIDCTNLETDATATACSNRSGVDPVSLDESALSGILAPLSYPYLLCQRGTVVLGNGTVVLPQSNPTAPTTSDKINCGLLKLGIFCLRECGLLRRRLGLC